jgi:hypothetical protein
MAMTWVDPYYSFSVQQQHDQQRSDRVWHNNNICKVGESISWEDRISGTGGGFPQCPYCAHM